MAGYSPGVRLVCVGSQGCFRQVVLGAVLVFRLTALSTLLATALSGADIPDPREIVRQAVEREIAATSRIYGAFNFQERVKVVELDADGRPKKVKIKLHDVLILDGSPHRILLEEDGRPAIPPGSDLYQGEIRQVLSARIGQDAAQRERRIAEFRKRRERYHKAIQEIPDAFVFRLLGEETVHGRPAYLIEAAPRPGYQSIDRHSKLFTETWGRIWIDKQELFWTKLEAELRDTVTFGWILVRFHPGSRVTMTQMRLEPGVWVPERVWYRVSLRVSLVRTIRLEEETIYSNYVRAQSDPRLARLR